MLIEDFDFIHNFNVIMSRQTNHLNINKYNGFIVFFN